LANANLRYAKVRLTGTEERVRKRPLSSIEGLLLCEKRVAALRRNFGGDEVVDDLSNFPS